MKTTEPMTMADAARYLRESGMFRTLSTATAFLREVRAAGRLDRRWYRADYTAAHRFTVTEGEQAAQYELDALAWPSDDGPLPDQVSTYCALDRALAADALTGQLADAIEQENPGSAARLRARMRTPEPAPGPFTVKLRSHRQHTHHTPPEPNSRQRRLMRNGYSSQDRA